MTVENYTFFPLAFRMKYINRWGLMRNTDNENLLEHSAQCAMLAHALAQIGNTYFGAQYDANAMAVFALYHDISEIYTGDLPTPVKYHNKLMSSSYKDIERGACEKLVAKLPEELQNEYDSILDYEADEQTRLIVKAADKLCALIKCMQEISNGNNEFSAALSSTKEALEKMCEGLPELEYFMENLLPEFEKSLDEL